MIKIKQTQENPGVGLLFNYLPFSFAKAKKKVEAKRENGQDPVSGEISPITHNPSQL